MWMVVLSDLLWALPSIFLWVAIAVYAMVSHARHPLRSNLTMAAMGILVLSRLFTLGAHAMAQTIAEEQGVGVLGTFYGISGAISTAFHLLAWLLVAVALFASPEEAAPI